MTNKIIRLESLSLMDYEDNLNEGGIFQTTRIIEVGHPYDEPKFKTVSDGLYGKLVECHSDRDVVSIKIEVRVIDWGCYKVRLKDGHELFLPMQAFIAESKEVTDDDAK